MKTGIRHVNDLLEEKGEILSFKYFVKKFNLHIDFQTYNDIVNSIKQDCRKKTHQVDQFETPLKSL